MNQIVKKIALAITLVAAPFSVAQADPLVFMTAMATAMTNNPLTTGGLALSTCKAIVNNPEIASTVLGYTAAAVAASSLAGYMIGNEITKNIKNNHYFKAAQWYAKSLAAANALKRISNWMLPLTIAYTTPITLAATTLLSLLPISLSITPTSMGYQEIKYKLFGNYL